jgi:hypothetical protein
MSESVLALQPVVLLPDPNQIVLCNAVPVTVRTKPSDAVLCLTIVDGDNNPLSSTVQGQAVGGVFADNIDFGPMPNGAAFIRVCYAVNGSCSNGSHSCVFIPIVIQCSTSTRKAKHGPKGANSTKGNKKGDRHNPKGETKADGIA